MTFLVALHWAFLRGYHPPTSQARLRASWLLMAAQILHCRRPDYSGFFFLSSFMEPEARWTAASATDNPCLIEASWNWCGCQHVTAKMQAEHVALFDDFAR